MERFRPTAERRSPSRGAPGNALTGRADSQGMNTTRTGSLAAALALTAATTVAVAPAHAAPEPAAPAAVQYVAQDSGSLSGGSSDNELLQAGLLIVAGLGVSALLAAGAGVAGGAIPLPEIPGLPQ